jgi:hypothetical protein
MPPFSDVLFCSTRGDIRHFHVHLLPLWPDEEKKWREVTGYPESHLMEFMGSLEKRHDFRVLYNIQKGEDEDAQRARSTDEISAQVNALRKITGYDPSRCDTMGSNSPLAWRGTIMGILSRLFGESRRNEGSYVRKWAEKPHWGVAGLKRLVTFKRWGIGGW